MCVRTCRDQYPDEPETWCDGCTEAEASDREANYQRWQEWRREVDRQLAAIAAARLAVKALCYQDTTL